MKKICPNMGRADSLSREFGTEAQLIKGGIGKGWEVSAGLCLSMCMCGSRESHLREREEEREMQRERERLRGKSKKGRGYAHEKSRYSMRDCPHETFSCSIWLWFHMRFDWSPHPGFLGVFLTVFMIIFNLLKHYAMS